MTYQQLLHLKQQQMKNNNSKAPTQEQYKDSVQLEVLTWQKDSHGLYDYEATKQFKEYFQIQGPCKMFRNWLTSQTVLYSNDQIKKGFLPEESFSFMSSINLKHNGNFDKFVLSPPERPSQDIVKKDANSDQPGPINTNTYIVVRFYKGPHGYPIQQGNIVKLGRVEFKVVEIGGIPKRYQRKQESFLGEYNGIYHANETMTGSCKFCLCDQSSDENFMISPCKCKGSCQGVHVQCLKMWIDSKVKKQVNGVVVSYNFTKFQCEICKEPFPRVVIKNQQQIEMITIEKPTKPYLILEGINERYESKEERCLHVIGPEGETPVKMGRGHQCEIRLQDISVSRMHSEIKYYCGQFYVSDQTSKFGTLVKVDKEIELNHRVKLQSGRSVYEFSLQ